MRRMGGTQRRGAPKNVAERKVRRQPSWSDARLFGAVAAKGPVLLITFSKLNRTAAYVLCCFFKFFGIVK